MNEKEVAELRRHLRPDKGNITRLRGCYVSDRGEILSEFDQAMGLLEQTDTELLYATLKKVLSGGLGKNLLDISFPTREVLEGEAHKLLMTLRSTALADDAAVHQFYEVAVASLHLDSSYVLFLAQDNYDIPHHGKDGGTFSEGATDAFSYLLCCICPIKASKPGLIYDSAARALCHSPIHATVSSPVLGFLFPAFENRGSNLYGALCYTKSTVDSHEDFIQAVFHAEAPMPADLQKESFQTILHEALAEECKLTVVQNIHDQLCEMMEEHKASRAEEPLLISRHAVTGMLASSGVDAQRVTQFEKSFCAEFGEDAELRPGNLIDAKLMQIKTPDVTIRVNPERPELIETRTLGGAKYIMIRADEGVEINGVDIHIGES